MVLFYGWQSEVNNGLLINYWTGDTQDSDHGGSSSPKYYVLPIAYNTFHNIICSPKNTSGDASGCLQVHRNTTLSTVYIHYFLNERSYRQEFWAISIGY